MISELKVGEMADVEVLRNGQKRKFKVTIAKKPERSMLAQEPVPKTTDGLGIHVSDLSQEMVDRFKLYSNAVVVVRIVSNSKADSAGLQLGDIILEINRTTIENIRDFEDNLKRVKSKKIFDLLIHRFHVGLMAIRFEK